MMSRSLIRFVAPLTALLTLLGCSTDLDVTAPYKEITVVYSLLDKDADTCWLKINKAFLGEGNAYEYAQIADSNEYTDAQFSGVVNAKDGSGNIIQTYPIASAIVNRPVGIFNGPQHKMYYIVPGAGGLNEDLTHELQATAKGNEVSASTPIVHDFQIYPSTANTTSNQAQLNLKTGQGYIPYEIRWYTGDVGKRYEVSYTFYYDEFYADNTSQSKSFTSYVGSLVSNGQDGSLVGVIMNGENFYQTVANQVPNDPNVSKRIFQGVTFDWAVAGPDLHTYLLLSQPISGVVEERPDFTNVNGGYGLFSSRLFKRVGGSDYNSRKRLQPTSAEELKTGQYTGGLHFCIPGDADCL